jgi:cob(I)alamin adenosyltransferase
MKKEPTKMSRPGDAGVTIVPSAGMVRKSDPRIEALGELDELNCVLGLLSLVLRGRNQANIEYIQQALFEIGGDLASPRRGRRVRFGSCDVLELEHEIRRLERRLPPLRGFVVPGANEAEARCHLARAVARRVERRVAALPSSGLNPEIPRYLNRLSSYLFSLARSLAGKRERTVKV